MFLSGKAYQIFFAFELPCFSTKERLKNFSKYLEKAAFFDELRGYLIYFDCFQEEEMVCEKVFLENQQAFLYQGQNVMRFSQQFQKKVNMDFDPLWTQILQKTQSNDNIFLKFESSHDVKKLKLHKISASQTEAKILKLRTRITQENQETSKLWIENEYRIYIWFILTYSETIFLHPQNYTDVQWNYISTIFNRTPLICRFFYRCCVKAKASTWTHQQDKIILDLMQNPKFYKKWTQIGIQMFRISEEVHFRKPKLIRERWWNHLDPSIKRCSWTSQEDAILLSEVEKKGKKWAKIGSIISGRSQHAVKNRYNHLLNVKCKLLDENYRILSEKTQLDLLKKEKNEAISKINAHHESSEETVKQEQELKNTNPTNTSFPIKNNQTESQCIVGYYFQPILIPLTPI